jgi:hypothetical protein
MLNVRSGEILSQEMWGYGLRAIRVEKANVLLS